jgi:hypothetical protein
MRTTHMLAFATILLAGTATAASACGAQASLTKAGFTTATTSQDLSAVSKKKKMSKDEMSNKKMMKHSTTGSKAGMNPAGGPGTGTTPSSKSSSTGNAGTGAGAAGGQSSGTATNSGQ